VQYTCPRQTYVAKPENEKQGNDGQMDKAGIFQRLELILFIVHNDMVLNLVFVRAVLVGATQ